MSSSNWQYDRNPFADNEVDSTMDPRPPTGYVPPTNTQFAPPPWLQDNSAVSSTTNPMYSAVPAAVPSPQVPVYAAGAVPPVAPVPAAAPASGASTDPSQLDPAIPRMILYTRIANLGLSLGMILTSLLSVMTTQSATTGVLALYVVVFSCLLCCFETHLKQVSKLIALNFGFMYSAKSRAAFMLFMGTIMFSFSLFGKLMGMAMLVNAGFNFFILFRYPQFEDAQRNHAQADIKDYLASHPAFASRIFTAGAAAGAELVKSNPQLAAQGASAMLAAATTPAAGAAPAGYSQV